MKKTDVVAIAHAPQSGAPMIKGAIRREETLVRYPVNGDNWHITWAADDQQYGTLCDGAGLVHSFEEMYNTRMVTISGDPQQARFAEVPGYPRLARPAQKENDARYYGLGTIACDGRLYQFLSTFNRGLLQNDGDGLCYNGAKLIYSPDHGVTWHNQTGSTPVVWESWPQRSRETLVFLDEDQGAFGLLTVLQMGRNYEQNRDGYVYVYSPNGIADGTMNELVMFRVPRDQLLRRSAYEYFAGSSPNGSARWNTRMSERVPVHTFPRGWVNTLLHPYAWQPSVVYNAPLGVYLMASWGMGPAADGWWFGKPSYLGFWVARAPWGPWTQIHEETVWTPAGDSRARCYQPQIAPKWLAPDGKSFWLVWTDYQTLLEGEALKQFEQTRKQRADANIFTQAEIVEWVAAMRKDMPYYAFNTQRVDLIVG